jgi:hypothetical protein
LQRCRRRGYLLQRCRRGAILCKGVEGGGILCRGVEGCVRVGKFPREIGLHEKVCIIAVINFGFSAQIKRTSCV